MRVGFVPTVEELVAVGLHFTRPDWEGRPGKGAAAFGAAFTGLFPLAAGAAIWPFDRPAGLVIGALGLLVTGPLLPAALIYRRGGRWLDAVRRRRATKNFRRHYPASGLTGVTRTVTLSAAGVTEEAGCEALFRAWPRCGHVDRVPVPRGGGEPGEVLAIGSVSGGPRPVGAFLPRRAAVAAGIDYEALACRCEGAADDARGSDPANPRWSPPFGREPAADAATFRSAPTAAEHEAAALAHRPRPGRRARALAAAVLTASVAGPVIYMHLTGGPPGLGWCLALFLGLSAAAILEYEFRRRGMLARPVRNAVRTAVAADPALTAPAVTALTGAGIVVRGSGFGNIYSWSHSAPVRTVAGFIFLPTAIGGAIFAHRRVFENAAAADRFAETAERLRTGPGGQAPGSPELSGPRRPHGVRNESTP